MPTLTPSQARRFRQMVAEDATLIECAVALGFSKSSLGEHPIWRERRAAAAAARRWTEAETATALDMHERGATDAEIGKVVFRTPVAVRSHLREHEDGEPGAARQRLQESRGNERFLQDLAKFHPNGPVTLNIVSVGVPVGPTRII